MAYIIPAYKVFDDIENRFGVPPRLPSETAPDPIQNRIVRSSEPTRHYTTAPRSSAAAFNFDDRVCEVRSPRTGSEWPLMYSPRQECNRAQPRIEVISPYSKKAQILQNSCSRAPLVTERRRVWNPFQALDTGVAARLEYLASCPTELPGDPPRHLNEDAKARTSRFNDLLRSRRLSKSRAAYDDSLGKLQQHGASLGNNYYRRLPIASMGEPSLHVIFESLQFLLGHPVETSWHREKRSVGHHNAVAHFEGTLVCLMEEMIRHRFVGFDDNKIISLLTVKLIDHLVDYRQVSWLAIIGISCRFPAGANDPEEFWSMLSEGRSAWSEVPSDRFNSKAFYHPSPDVNGTTNHQRGHFLTQDISAFDASFFGITPSKANAMDPHHRLALEIAYETLENARMRKSRDMFLVRAVDLKRHSPHHIHSAGTVEALFSLIAQGMCPKTLKSWYPNNYQLPGIASNNAQVMRHGNLEICCPSIDMILVTQIQNNNGYKPQLIASFPGLFRAFSELYREQSSSVDYGTDARVLEGIRLLFALASLSLPASLDNVDYEVCFWDIMFEARNGNGRGVQRGL